MADCLIDARALSKIYGGRGETKTRALDRVNMAIKKSEFVAIMGPSGSGKSTLMYILGALDRPTWGRYFLDGQDVAKESEIDLARIRSEKIGFVFQSFNLLPRTSALENVMMPLLYSKKFSTTRRERAVQLLAQVDLEKKFKSFPSQLSGGEQQRVAIARALIGDPQIILADEPTGNLDTASGDEIIKILAGLNREGRTVLVVTHNPRVAQVSQRIITMEDGKIVSDKKN